MTELTRDEAIKESNRLMQEARDIITSAETLADKYNFTIDFDLAYGMGGTYFPVGYQPEWADSDWADSNDSETGWVSSSSQC